MPLAYTIQVLGQPAPDLVEDQADERLGARYVAGRDDDVERGRRLAANQIGDPPVTAPRHLGNHRIAIETKERHGGAENA